MRTVVWAGALVLGSVFCVSASGATRNLGSKTTFSGEQKQWHKVSLTFAGPSTSETNSVNPFTNYRLNVTFKHSASNRTLIVPGYFAADGNAANTGAVSGDKWRVDFTPDATGTWTYVASFRTGSNVAASTSATAGTATSFNGESGSFTIDPTDKTGADFRAKGRLREVGQHYLQHAGSKEYFIKSGAGSPENFLAFADFDNTSAGKKILHHYTAHLSAYRSGDPTWKSGKGKAIIGALNYLASKKVNSVYFLTMNIGGDGDDVFPFVSKTDRTRFDVSKLAQWEIVFSHMDKLGIMLNVVTQEQECDQLLDGGSLGNTRKIYYRELVARFGHHLGVTWNLGEENTNTDAQREAFADYLNALDPYFSLIAVHTYPSQRDTIYTGHLGSELISGASLQLESPSIVHEQTLKWVKKSAAAGSKWVVSVDELGPSSAGVVPDANDPAHETIVHRVLWGSLLAGGAGVEWYFGYNYPQTDLTLEDWKSRDKMWTLTQHAAQFMRDYMPLPLVANYDSITSSTSDYCFGKPGVAYAIYLPQGAITNITVPSGEGYTVHWYNPRAGGSLQTGTVKSIAGGTAAIGRPPTQQSEDWVALLRRTSGTTTGAPAPAPTEPTSTTAVTQLTLVNASTEKDLRALTNGSTITFGTDGKALNVRATTSGTVGSVAFILDGQTIQTENMAPYTLAGDSNGDYASWTPSVGTHVLKVVPYSGRDRTGNAGTALQVSFTVQSTATEDSSSAPVVSEPASGASVTKLTLINASTEKDLRALTNGSTITFGTDGKALNVRAETSGTVGSVAFILDGKTLRTENVAPYTLAGDGTGNYYSWTPSVGSHTLKVVPYSGKDRTGTAGTSLQVGFTVK
ncbi:DUF5060 domain-containing protein [Opitutus terrae]|uniref:DUF5060 domain-containing protein n=1 Tax=Opitutus terrae TaxID=107709 RepID=UPI0013053939|nr:DUF5060 domain-containing protein [Opitutus terrae]